MKKGVCAIVFSIGLVEGMQTLPVSSLDAVDMFVARVQMMPMGSPKEKTARENFIQKTITATFKDEKIDKNKRVAILEKIATKLNGIPVVENFVRQEVGRLLGNSNVYIEEPEQVGMALLNSNVRDGQIVSCYDLDTILRAMDLLLQNNRLLFNKEMKPLLERRGLGGYIPR